MKLFLNRFFFSKKRKQLQELHRSLKQKALGSKYPITRSRRNTKGRNRITHYWPNGTVTRHSGVTCMCGINYILNMTRLR